MASQTDPDDDPTRETVYECLDCGYTVRSDSQPGSCPECGSTLRNEGYPIE